MGGRGVVIVIVLVERVLSGMARVEVEKSKGKRRVRIADGYIGLICRDGKDRMME